MSASETETTIRRGPVVHPATGLKRAWQAEIVRVAAEHRWPVALMVLAWLHLAFFTGCQSIVWFLPAPRPHWVFPAMWFAEVIATYLVMNVVCGRRWAGGSPVGLVVVRIWGTYLILAFGLSTLNSWSGWGHDWFKPVWGTIGTFGFATMAWLFSFWFLVPAFQMYFMSLLMVKFPEWNFLIHGLSWWLALNGISLVIWDRCRRVEHEEGIGLRVQVGDVTRPMHSTPLPRGPLPIVLAQRPDVPNKDAAHS